MVPDNVMKRARQYVQWIVFFILFLFDSTLAQAEPFYNLAQLESLALQANPAVLAVRDQVAASRSVVTSASALPNPEVEYLLGTIRSRTPAGSQGNAYTFSIAQPIDFLGRRQSRVAVAEAGLEQTIASVRGFEVETIARVRRYYFDLVRREEALKYAEEDAASMEKVRSAVAKRVGAGESPKFELVKSEAETQNAKKVARMAVLRVEQARLQLRQSVGNGLPIHFKIQGHLPELLQEPHPIPSLDILRKELVQNNPDLARAQASLKRAQRQLDYEYVQRKPSLALKASLEQEPDIRSSKIGVVVTVPLWDQRKGFIGEAAAQLSSAQHELETQEFFLLRSLETQYQQYEIAKTQLAALESNIVKQAATALKIAESAYRFGERGFLEVLDAQRVYRIAKQELIEARFELASAWVEIEKLRAIAHQGVQQ